MVQQGPQIDPDTAVDQQRVYVLDVLHDIGCCVYEEARSDTVPLTDLMPV